MTTPPPAPASHPPVTARAKDDGPASRAGTSEPVQRNEVIPAPSLPAEAADVASHRAEAAHRHFAALVESSDDAIVSKDTNGFITSWNKAAERIFGYTEEEAIGQSITMLIPADRQHEEPMILSRIRRGERVDHYETVRQRRDGTLIDISLTVSPIKDREGRVVGVSKIARDITDRKRSEMQQQALYDLALSVNRAVALDEIYASTLDAMCRCQRADRAAILLVDADEVMRFKAWHNLSDACRAGVEGHLPWRLDARRFKPITMSDIMGASLDPVARAALRAEGVRSLAFIPLTFEERLLGNLMIAYDTPQGFTPAELQPAEVIATQVSFAVERQRSAAALESLVNERTASLREAVAQMEEFSYTVSHDLRAPLRGMQVYSQALLEDYANKLDTEARHCLERIADNASRLDRMVLDVLTFSRVSRNEVSLEPVSLGKLVRELVANYPGMQEPQAEIVIDPLHDVLGHEPSVVQVVSNLLSNAVKFVPAGTKPRVRVWSEPRPDGVRLWIEDNGIGIAPAYQNRLFRMFERVHPNLNYDGTGVGLAIVRKAVTRMGGEVGVVSDGTNGSRFWIRFQKPPETSSGPA